jgi:hypothetical protein
MCVLGVGEQEEGQETPSHPSLYSPFLPFLLDTLTGFQGDCDSCPTWLKVRGPGTGLVFIPWECMANPHPTTTLPERKGCILLEAIPLPSGGKGQRKQIFVPR